MEPKKTGKTSKPAPRAARSAVAQGAEGNVEHIRAHLDVLVNGKAVAVPADIGIDGRRAASAHCTPTTAAVLSTSSLR
jgi:hypothetical protein